MSGFSGLIAFIHHNHNRLEVGDNSSKRFPRRRWVYNRKPPSPNQHPSFSPKTPCRASVLRSVIEAYFSFPRQLHDAFLASGLSSCSAILAGLAGVSSSSLASRASFQSELRRLIFPGGAGGSLGLARGLVGVALMLLILSVRPWPRSPLRTLRPSAFCLLA